MILSFECVFHAQPNETRFTLVQGQASESNTAISCMTKYGRICATLAIRLELKERNSSVKCFLFTQSESHILYPGAQETQMAKDPETKYKHAWVKNDHKRFYEKRVSIDATR